MSFPLRETEPLKGLWNWTKSPNTQEILRYISVWRNLCRVEFCSQGVAVLIVVITHSYLWAEFRTWAIRTEFAVLIPSKTQQETNDDRSSCHWQQDFCCGLLDEVYCRMFRSTYHDLTSLVYLERMLPERLACTCFIYDQIPQIARRVKTRCRKNRRIGSNTNTRPGFTRGRRRQTQRGRQPIIWPIFPENCMQIRKLRARGVAHPSPAPRIRHC